MSIVIVTDIYIYVHLNLQTSWRYINVSTYLLTHSLGMTQNCIPSSEIIIPNRECVMRLGIGEGTNVIFKQVSHAIR